MDEGFFCALCLRHEPVLAPLRGRADFATVVARATARHLAFARRYGLVPETGRPGTAAPARPARAVQVIGARFKQLQNKPWADSRPDRQITDSS